MPCETLNKFPSPLNGQPRKKKQQTTTTKPLTVEGYMSRGFDLYCCCKYFTAIDAKKPILYVYLPIYVEMLAVV